MCPRRHWPAGPQLSKSVCSPLRPLLCTGTLATFQASPKYHVLKTHRQKNQATSEATPTGQAKQGSICVPRTPSPLYLAEDAARRAGELTAAEARAGQGSALWTQGPPRGSLRGHCSLMPNAETSCVVGLRVDSRTEGRLSNRPSRRPSPDRARWLPPAPPAGPAPPQERVCTLPGRCSAWTLPGCMGCGPTGCRAGHQVGLALAFGDSH